MIGKQIEKNEQKKFYPVLKKNLSFIYLACDKI